MAFDGALKFDTKIDKSGFDKGIKNIENSLGSLKKALGGIAAAVGISFSVNTIKQFTKACTDAYNVQVTAETKIETIMRQRMNSTDAQIKSIKQLASAQQEQGIIGDEVQLAGAQQAATFLSEEESLKSLIPAMNNLLAQQKGVNATSEDAVSIGNMFGKVMQGQTSALRRVGITFSAAEEKVLKYGTETERAATLAKVITNNVGEMNSVLAQTNMGRQKQLSNTLGDIQEQFGQAVQQVEILFLPALTRVSNLLSLIVTQAQKAAQAVANVFGAKSNSQNESGANPSVDLSDISADTADSTGETADNYKDIADSAEKAAKAAQENLSAFDELNVMSQDTAQTSAIDTASADEAAQDIADSVSDKEAVMPVELSVDEDSEESELEKMLNRIKSKFDEFTGKLAPLNAPLESLWATLKEIGGYAWDNVQNFYNDFLKPIGDWTLGEGLPKFVEITDTFLQSIDWEKINKALDDFYKSLEPFAENVGEGLLWLYENVLTPLGEWVMNDAVPAFLDAVGGALDLINSIGENAGILLQVVWDKFLSKVAEFTGDAITKFLETLGQFLHDVSENETAVNTIIGIATAIGIVAAAFGTLKAAIALVNVVMGLSPVTWLMLAFAALIVVIVEIITYWDTLKWIWQEFVEIWKKGVSEIWNGITQKFSKIKSKIVDFLQSISEKWQNAWNKVKNTFLDVWEDIKNGIKQPINFIIDIINGLLNGIEAKINGLIDAANSFSFDVPDWVPGIGGGHIGFDFSHVDIPDIPHLATGTVVPANYGEFTAVLGDNKREPEIVSPISAMKQAFIEAMTESGYLSGRNDDRDIVIQIDGHEVFRAMRKQNNNFKRAHGGKSGLA